MRDSPIIPVKSIDIVCVYKNAAMALVGAYVKRAHAAERAINMNTARKRITLPRCTECNEVFMVVDSTPIRLAFPRLPTQTQTPFQDDQGICPKHPRKVNSNAE